MDFIGGNMTKAVRAGELNFVGKNSPSLNASSYCTLAGQAPNGDSAPMEIVFSVTQEADCGYVAECLSHDIFTQGDNWEQVRANVQAAVAGSLSDQARPARVRLHLVRDELLA